MPTLKEIVLPNDIITSDKLASNTITSDKFANNAVTGDKLANVNLTASQRLPQGHVINVQELASMGNTDWHTSFGNLSYTYTAVRSFSYTPLRSDSTIFFEHYYTFHHTRSDSSWCIHLGKVRDDTLGTFIAGHCWHGGSYPTQYSHSSAQHFWKYASWGTTSRTFTYYWAPHPGITNNYYGSHMIMCYEVTP